MFFAFHILILLISQITRSVNYPIKSENYPDEKDPTENGNFFKSGDGPHYTATSSAAFNSLFEVLQNISLMKSTTQNSKSDIYDSMFSDEMISIKQLIYDKEKNKLPTPSIEIKQHWPVLEFMSKLNNVSEIKDELEIDILGNFIVNNTHNIIGELEDVREKNKTISENLVSSTEIHTMASDTVEAASTPKVNSIISITKKTKDSLLDLQKENSNRDQMTILHEDFNFNGIGKSRKKVIDLRSLNHNDHNDFNKACTCKQTEKEHTRSIRGRSVSYRCTAKYPYMNDNKNNNDLNNMMSATNPCTAMSQRHIPEDLKQCAVTLSCPTISCQQEITLPSCPPYSPATTCIPISTTTYYTTCYTIYPSTVLPVTVQPTINYQAQYQPYVYQPYMFIQDPNTLDTLFKPPKKLKSKRYKEEQLKESYDEYYMDDYKEFIENSGETDRKQKNDCKQIILQEHGCKNDKKCTRGIDDTDGNEFVNEVVNDLKRYYGDSVLRHCYCGSNLAACIKLKLFPVLTFSCLCIPYLLNSLLQIT